MQWAGLSQEAFYDNIKYGMVSYFKGECQDGNVFK